MRDVLFEEGTGITIYFKGIGGALDDDANIKFFDLMLEDDLSLVAVDEVFSKKWNNYAFFIWNLPQGL
ncbi:MAG: hypothetical protein ACYCXB_01220 [Candidatus Humimicrobiaceae bacterium]